MYIGIDLAGTRTGFHGVAWLEGKKVRTRTIRDFSSLLSFSNKFKIAYVDAPLSVPLGRRSLKLKDGRHFRDCDKMLRKEGIKFFPITLGPMRKLTALGIEFCNRFSGFYHETFPGAFYDVFGIPRKNMEVQVSFYRKLGFSAKPKNQHESDAVACLITAYLDSEGKASHLIGRDGCIAIPSLEFRALRLKV